MTHLHNFSPPAVTPTSCRRRNSNLGYRFVFIFYLLASPCSLLGSLLALGWFTVLSLNISYCYGIVCVAVQRNVDSNFVSVWYVLIFWLGNLCWHFICGLIHTQCWFVVVCVSEEIFVGFVGVAVVNGLWTCWLLEYLGVEFVICLVIVNWLRVH